MDLDKLRQRTLDRVPQGRQWYAISNKSGPTATLRIYDEVWYFGVNADDFARDLASITAPEIEVQINSPGGDVFDGVAIFNALRAHSARVTTRVDGLAASIASVIAQAGDHRVMLSGAQMMIHEAWGLVIGPAADMRQYADLLDKQSEVVSGIYAERSGGDAAGFRDMMATETWFSAEEAVAAGLADEVVSPPRKDAPGAGTDKTLHNEIADAVGAVKAAIDSAERVDALRAEAGKPLSGVVRDSLDELRAQATRLDALLSTDPGEDVREVLNREHARFISINQGV